jgi:hypothetical protein
MQRLSWTSLPPHVQIRTGEAICTLPRAQSLRSPDPEPTSPGAEHVQPAGVSTAAGNETVGSLMTTIYSSVRSGALYVPVMDCLRDVTRDR